MRSATTADSSDSIAPSMRDGDRRPQQRRRPVSGLKVGMLMRGRPGGNAAEARADGFDVGSADSTCDRDRADDAARRSRPARAAEHARSTIMPASDATPNAVAAGDIVAACRASTAIRVPRTPTARGRSAGRRSP